MEAQLKHLEFVQNVIARMANNSFLIKGWAITLVTAVLTLGKSMLSGQESFGKIDIVVVAVFIVIIFWALDGFFLCTEARFRLLFKKLAKGDGDVGAFEMNPLKYKKEWQYVGNTFSKTLIPFYGALLLLPCFIFQVSFRDLAVAIYGMLKHFIS